MKYLEDLITETSSVNERFEESKELLLAISNATKLDTIVYKELVKKYFGDIPSSSDVVRNLPKEDPIEETIKAKWYDPNIQFPALLVGYITPKMNSRESRILNLLSTYLSDGKSSVLYKKMVDDKKMALAVQTVNLAQEDYGTYILFGLPQGETKLADIISEIDEEVLKMQTTLISEKAYQKLQNQFWIKGYETL